MDTKKFFWRLAPLVIYLLALLLRLINLSETAVYPDEITWMVKGKETIYAFKQLNIEYFRTQGWWKSDKDTYAIGLPLILLSGLSHVLLAGTGKFSLHLFSDITASRLPVVFVGSLLPPAIYVFTSKYLGRKFSSVAAIIYALSPIAIALDRWVLHDSYLSLFSFLAIITFIDGKKFTPGIFLSLAYLTKPHGILPIIAWGGFLLMKRQKIIVKSLVINLGIFLALTTILWPESWFDPIISIPKYIYNQATLTRIGDPIPNFYMGHPTFSPDWSYYFFQIFTRTPEIILVCLMIAIYFFLKRLKTNSANNVWPIIVAVSLYILSFLVVLNFASIKGGVRYLLPLLPWIYIAAAWGIKQSIMRPWHVVILAIPALFLYPNYYLYYNYFIGGPTKAQKYDLVGACFGTKPALEYLDNNNIIGTVSIIGCADTAPYHTGRDLTKDWTKAEFVILESSYKQQFPEKEAVRSVEKRTKLATIYQSGVPTATIYQ